MTVPSRPTSLPFSFSLSVLSLCSSSSFRRRKKLLKEIQRLGLELSAELRLPSPPGLPSPSLGRTGELEAELLVQLPKCLWRMLEAWYGEDVDLGGGKGALGSERGLESGTAAEALWDLDKTFVGVSFFALERQPSVVEKRDLGRVRVSFMASGGRAYSSSVLSAVACARGDSGGDWGGWMEATICESTVLASSLWLTTAPGDKDVSVPSSLLHATSPLVLQVRTAALAVGLVLGWFAVMERIAVEFVDVVGERAPTVELITVLVTVLGSVVVLGCKFGGFDTASGRAFVSSKEALSDVPLPDIVFSVEEDWTLSQDPISSYVWLVTRLLTPFGCGSSPLSPKKLLYTARLSYALGLITIGTLTAFLELRA